MGLNAFARHDEKTGGSALAQGHRADRRRQARNNYQIRRAYYVLGRICIQSGRKDEGVSYTKVFSEMQDKTMADSRANTPASKTQGTMGSGMAGEPSVPTSAVIDPGAQLGEAAPQLTPQQKAEVKTAEQRVSVDSRRCLQRSRHLRGAPEAVRHRAELFSAGGEVEPRNSTPDAQRRVRRLSRQQLSRERPRLEGGRAAGTRRQDDRAHAGHGAVLQRAVCRRREGLRPGRRCRVLRSARRLRMGDVAGAHQPTRQSCRDSRPPVAAAALARVRSCLSDRPTATSATSSRRSPRFRKASQAESLSAARSLLRRNGAASTQATR